MRKVFIPWMTSGPESVEALGEFNSIEEAQIAAANDGRELAEIESEYRKDVSEHQMTIINAKQATIDTVVPQIKLGEIMLSADRRSTKEKPLSDAERIRRAVLPADQFTEFAGTIKGERSQGLTDLIRSALQAIGNDRLRDTLAANPDARTIELSDYTIPALLAWNAESSTSRGSITFTRDEVTAWFATSATRSTLVEKHSANPKLAGILALVEKRFATLAAKNHGLATVDDADKLLALIADADATGPKAALVGEIAGRIAHITKQLAAKAAEDTVSMDDI